MRRLRSFPIVSAEALRVVISEGPAVFWRKLRLRNVGGLDDHEDGCAADRSDVFDHKSTWDEQLLTQLDHWDRWLAGESGEGPKNRLTDSYPFPGYLQKVLDCPPGSEVRVLDLGSGPASTVGRNWPGRKVFVTCVDPLAEEYNVLLRKHGYAEFACIARGCGETLLEDIEERDFDIAYSANALDHSYDPLLCIENMLRIVRPKGWVVFMVLENEGQRQRYGGLHRWNFCVDDGELVLWDKSGRSYVVANEIRDSTMREILIKEDQQRGNRIFVYLTPASGQTDDKACDALT